MKESSDQKNKKESSLDQFTPVTHFGTKFILLPMKSKM